MEKEEKFMEIYKATINRDNDKTTLSFQLRGITIELVLTEDKPNNVKDVFNKLLHELKNGEFNFGLKDSTEDLYYHISSEYISQLNSELSSIYKELEDYELIETGDEN